MNAVAASAAQPRSLDVFINCPYDDTFRPYLDAILFVVVCCGYEPHLADNVGRSSTARMERIFTTLRRCGLSIHDLSLVHADEKTGVAHLNMPLELGIAMAITRYAQDLSGHPAGGAGAGPGTHEWLALVKQGSPYGSAISDLNGYDLTRYETRETLVENVFDWLTLQEESPAVGFFSDRVIKLLSTLDTELKALRGGRVTRVPWQHIVVRAREIAQLHQLQPSKPA